MVDQNAGDKVKSMGTAMEEAEPGKEQAVMESGQKEKLSFSWNENLAVI